MLSDEGSETSNAQTTNKNNNCVSLLKPSCFQRFALQASQFCNLIVSSWQEFNAKYWLSGQSASNKSNCKEIFAAASYLSLWLISPSNSKQPPANTYQLARIHIFPAVSSKVSDQRPYFVFYWLLEENSCGYLRNCRFWCFCICIISKSSPGSRYGFHSFVILD